MTRGPRLLLGLAAIAVAFAAADTYVVVLALPDMMTTVGLNVNELQRAAPIVSGFLLGYVAMLPLIGRIADLRGRVPVLVAALVVFAFGSLVTALAFDLPSLVAGRFLQGMGGGGLVPATLALVADLYPSERRAVPLGVISAVQEIGSVLGPLYGAVVLAVADWEAIFWLNLAVGLVLAAAVWSVRGARTEDSSPRPRPDLIGALLLVLAVACLVLMLAEPQALVTDVTLGYPFVPLTGTSRWLAPLSLLGVLAAIVLVWRCWRAPRPLVDLRSWLATARAADPLGSGLLAVVLAGVIVAFASADPQIQVFNDLGWVSLAVSAVCAVLFWLHLRRTPDGLVPRGALRRTPAWGSLVVSLFVGAALIAALVDVPVFARLTAYPDSQLMAALVLVRLLVAIPAGAVAGGFAMRRVPAGWVTALGMLLAATGFLLMSRWTDASLHSALATIPLLVTGLGFGLALAPVNAAALDATADDVHGLASAFVVVARMVGMLVGISALTTIGLRRFYALLEAGASAGDAALAQVHTIFLGAAVCAGIAGVAALVLFDRAPARSALTGETLRAG